MTGRSIRPLLPTALLVAAVLGSGCVAFNVGEPETFKKKRVPRFGSLRLASREEGTRSHGLNIIYWKVSGAIREFKNRHELLEESKEMEEDESDEDSL